MIAGFAQKIAGMKVVVRSQFIIDTERRRSKIHIYGDVAEVRDTCMQSYGVIVRYKQSRNVNKERGWLNAGHD